MTASAAGVLKYQHLQTVPSLRVCRQILMLNKVR